MYNTCTCVYVQVFTALNTCSTFNCGYWWVQGMHMLYIYPVHVQYTSQTIVFVHLYSIIPNI